MCLAQRTATSDPQALALAAKALAALTGGLRVNGVTMNADAIWIAGSDNFTGTAVLQATGTSSQMDLNLSGLQRSETRTVIAGVPSGTWVDGSAAPQPYALQNCLTDTVWFFPSLSSLVQMANVTFVFSYIGTEQHGGVSVQHLRWSQTSSPADPRNLFNVQRLSTTDIYLDSFTFLPAAIAYNVHPDNDIYKDIPVETRFANYQVVSGVQVPLHIQQSLNGGVVLDLTITSSVVN